MRSPTAQAMIAPLRARATPARSPFHATGGTTNTANDPERTTTITVMVTAENGYNDHAYTFSLGAHQPVDNVLARDEILNQAGSQAAGDGGDGQTQGIRGRSQPPARTPPRSP